MRFKFVVNPEYVFLHAINMAQKKEPFAGWGEYTNKIYEKNPVIFYFLAGAPEYELYLSAEQDRERIVGLSDKVLANQKQTSEYQRLIKETEDYLAFVKNQWEGNKDRALAIISELMGITLPDTDIMVYLTHPQLNNGLSLDEHTLVWGHPEDFDNYSTVYLCHELMHILTNLDNSDIMHAIIELMIDNELRIRINNRGDYFEQPGHDVLVKLEKKILPDWKKYLERSDKNILEFIVLMKQKWGQL